MGPTKFQGFQFNNDDKSLIQLSKFNDEYDFLYNAKSEVAGEREAVALFDDLCNNNESFLEFVREYVKSRGYDPISSDRECAAFMFALDDMGVEF